MHSRLMLAARSIYAGGLTADTERPAGRRVERAGLLGFLLGFVWLG